MASPISFSVPLKMERPYGTHRFDVFSPKLTRRLTLYGRRMLKTWVGLETNAGIRTFCEYPLEIADLRRTVDFWVQDDDRSVFWLLLRASEEERALAGKTEFAAFQQWAIDRQASVRLLYAEEQAISEIAYSNTELALHYVSANMSLVTSELATEVIQCCAMPFSLLALEREFSSRDPILVRAAALLGILRGQLVCDTFAHEPMGPHSVFRAVLP